MVHTCVYTWTKRHHPSGPRSGRRGSCRHTGFVRKCFQRPPFRATGQSGDRRRADLGCHFYGGDRQKSYSRRRNRSRQPAIRGAAEAAEPSGRRHLVASAIEHEAVLNPSRLWPGGWRTTFVPVNQSGVVSADAVRAAMADDRRRSNDVGEGAVDALTAAGGAHVDDVAVGEQVAPFDKRHSHVSRQERVLEVRGVVGAGREQDDLRLVACRGRGRRAQRRWSIAG